VSIPFPTPIPFVQAQGFALQRFDGGVAELVLDLRDDQRNAFNVAHGGLLMTLLDVAMAHAARSPAAPGGAVEPRGVVTVEMKTSFMRPGDGRLTAQGRVLHQSATLAFCEGDVRSASGELLAHATGTFKYLKRLPTAGRQLRPLNHDEPPTQGAGSD
jgi:uncharacterized protein (TIGR00369 family)